MPANATIKAYTDSGKLMSPYTMGVLFRPEFKSKKYEKKCKFDWVYTCDNVEKFFAAKNQFFNNGKDALLEYFWLIAHRCLEIQVFDNRKPKGEDRLLYVIDGIVRERAGVVVKLRIDQGKRKLIPLP